jgi:tetratricopeptide (TPR) repeat protein
MTALYLHADAERRQAVQRFTEVRALSRYMLNDLTTTLEQFPGTAPLRGQLAQKGRVYLEGLSRIPDPPADVRLEVAKGYAKTGDVVTRLGKQNSADPRAGATDLAQAETRLRALRVSNPNDDVTLALAQVLISRAGLALTADNQPKLASTHLVEACRLSTALETVRPSWFDAKMAHIACLSGQANIADFEGRFAEVMAITDDALAEVNRLPSGDDPVIAALAKAKLLNLQGDAQYYLDSKPKALIALIKAANVLDAARHVRADVRLFDQIAMTTYNIASTLEDLGRRREELTWIDRGVAAADEMRAFEDSPHAWRTVNIVHLQRATTLASLGRFREAMVEAEANIAVRRTIAARSPNDNLAVRALPVGLRPLGDIYWKAGRKQKACRAYTEAQQLWDRLGKQGGVLGSDRGGEIVLVAGKVHTCDLAEISSGRG